MKLKLLVIISLVVFLYSNCRKDNNSEFTDTPIVESYLETGDYLKVKVSRQESFSSDIQYSSEDINSL